MISKSIQQGLVPDDETVPLIEVLSIAPKTSAAIPTNPEFKTDDILTIQLLVSLNGKFDDIETLISRVWTLDGIPLNINSQGLISRSDPSSSSYLSLDLYQFAEGSAHTLVCNVTSISSKLSTAYTLPFTIAKKPLPCYCLVSPSSGYALETVFSISCQNCLTKNTGLQVSFTDYKNGLKVILMDDTIAELSTQLPYTGSSELQLNFLVKDLSTGSQVETSIKQTVLLPKANSVLEVKKKKTVWDTFYRSLLSSDPRKVVFNYITTTVIGMTSALSNRRNLRDIKTCLNGGVYNNRIGMCVCKPGYKKKDCSMTVEEWQNTTSTWDEIGQLMLDEFNTRSDVEIPYESKISSQVSALYHLLDNYDEIGSDLLNQGLEVLKRVIQDSNRYSYLTISDNMSKTMASTLGSIYKSKISLNESSTEFENQIKDTLSLVSSIRFRNQMIGNQILFDCYLTSLVSTKLYPADLSNLNLDSVQLPPGMSKYLKNVNVRKAISPRVWKKSISSIVSVTNSTIGNTLMITRERNAGYTLSLELGNQNVNIQDKVIQYFFNFTKSFSSSRRALSLGYRYINTTNEIVCQSDDNSCELTQLGVDYYVCKCAQPSFVSIVERSIDHYVEIYAEPPVSPSTSTIVNPTPSISIKPPPVVPSISVIVPPSASKVVPKPSNNPPSHSTIPSSYPSNPKNPNPTSNGGDNTLVYLAFLSLLVVLVIIIIIVVIVVICIKKRGKNSRDVPGIELKSV